MGNASVYMYLRDEGIASMMRDYVRPFVERYGNTPWLFAIEPGNELEWAGVPGENDAGIPKDRIIRYVAEVARTVRRNSKVLVTQGAASIRWISEISVFSGSFLRGTNLGYSWRKYSVASGSTHRLCQFYTRLSIVGRYSSRVTF